MIRRTALLALATVAACSAQLGATAGTGPLSGSVVSTDRTWVCNGPVDLDSVTVTMTADAPGGASGRDAIHLASGCTGRIGRLEVATSIADGIKVAQGVHDLTIGGGRVRCLAKNPTLHQDGIQVMGGSNITFTAVIVDCGRVEDDLINSNLFVNQSGNSTEPPTDVLCVSCVFGGSAAHTVSIQNSVRSGVVDSSLCPARFPKQTLAIGPDAVEPVNLRNRVGAVCSGPLLSVGADTDAVTYGQPVVLGGSIVAADPQPMIVAEARVAGSSAFTNVATVAAGADDGAWQLLVRPGVQTSYRVEAGGATSLSVVVDVRPRLRLRQRNGVLVASAFARRPLRGRAVVLELQQAGTWTAIGRYRLGARSTVAIVPRLPVRPARVRVSIGPTAGYLAAASSAVVVR